jgi:hypothetical protein
MPTDDPIVLAQQMGEGSAAMSHEIQIPESTSVQTTTEDHLAFERLLADLCARFANVPDDDIETGLAKPTR